MTVTELNCPACAAPLRVADLDKESGAATCSYCGHEFDALPLLKKPEATPNHYLRARLRAEQRRRKLVMIACWVTFAACFVGLCLLPPWKVWRSDSYWLRPVSVLLILGTLFMFSGAIGATGRFRKHAKRVAFEHDDAEADNKAAR